MISTDNALVFENYYANLKQQVSDASVANGGVPQIADVSGSGDMAFFMGYLLVVANGPVVISINPGVYPDLASSQASATQLAQLVVGAV